MQRRSECLDAIDETWSGAREEAVRRDGIERTSNGKLSSLEQSDRLGGRNREAVAARHEDNDLGVGFGDLLRSLVIAHQGLSIGHGYRRGV